VNKTRETNEVLPGGVMLKTLEFSESDSRLIWEHNNHLPQGHRIQVHICATYVCGVLSGLELSFWMTVQDNGESVPYNITHTYAGAAEELHVIDTDLGRFNGAQRPSSGGIVSWGPKDQYQTLKEEGGFYPIQFPGKDGEFMTVLVPRTRRPTCGWTHDENHDCYETRCDNAYVFEYELKLGDSHKFCPGCGRLIEIVSNKKTFSPKWTGAFELPPADLEDARLTHLLQGDEENVLAKDDARPKPEAQTKN
jgi:hypothetical protein